MRAGGAGTVTHAWMKRHMGFLESNRPRLHGMALACSAQPGESKFPSGEVGVEIVIDW
jgi:hypothetical protein